MAWIGRRGGGGGQVGGRGGGGSEPKGANVTAVSSDINFVCYMCYVSKVGRGFRAIPHKQWGYATRPGDIFLALRDL